MRNRHDGERGQAAIELILVFPLFMFITFIALDFGLWMYQWVAVSNAVRESARYGAVNCPDDGGCSVTALKQRAVDKSSGVLDTIDIDAGWAASSSAGAGLKGSSVVVKAEHNYSLRFLPGVSVPIRSCASMRMERDSPDTTAGPACS